MGIVLMTLFATFCLKILCLVIFCSQSLCMKMIVLYSPCDDRLFQVLHAVHKAIYTHFDFTHRNSSNSTTILSDGLNHKPHDLGDVCQWIQHGTFGVIAVANNTQTWSQIASQSILYNLPFSMNSYPCRCSTSSSGVLDTEVLALMAFDFLKEEFLQEVIILHENASESAQILSSLLNAFGVRVMQIDAKEINDSLNWLKNYFKAWNDDEIRGKRHRLVALGSSSTLDYVLYELLQSRRGSIKLLIADSPSNWQERLYQMKSYEVDLVIISSETSSMRECPTAIEIMPSGFHGDANDQVCELVPEETRSLGNAILLDVELYLNQCCLLEKNEHYEIWKSIPGDGGMQILKPVAVWSPSIGLMKVNMLNFHPMTLRIALLQYPPYVIIDVTKEGEVILHDCVLKEMLMFLSKKLNFRYKLVTPSDNNWGHVASDGKWTGLIGMMIKGEADLVPYLTLTPARKGVVDFSKPVATAKYGILVVSPSEPPRSFIFLRPYKKEVWFTICGAAILISVVLCVIHRLSVKFVSNKLPQKGLTIFSNCFWFVFGAMLQQSGIHMPDTVSARLVMATWWLSLLVILATYSGNLIAFLTFPEARWMIRSLEDLANDDRMMLVIEEGCPLLDDFKESNVEVYKKIRMNYLENPKRGFIIKDTNIDIVSLVVTGRIVMIDDANFLSNTVEKDYKENGRCRITVAPELFSKMETSFAFRRGSSLLPLLNEEIQQMAESGVLYHWKAMYAPRRTECFNLATTLQGGSTSVKFDDLQGVFYLLGLGLAISVVFLACEVVRLRLSFLIRYQRMK